MTVKLRFRRQPLPCSLIIFLMIAVIYPAAAQEWSYYAGTQAGMKYSALDQVNRSNVTDLAVAWSYRTGELDRYGDEFAAGQRFESTPVLIEGQLILCTPAGRLIALDPATGKERWQFDSNTGRPEYVATAPWAICRGITPWHDPLAAEGAVCRSRILYGTWEFKVYAIDVNSGRPCPDFGANGVVMLDPGKPLVPGEVIQITSPPVIIGDIAAFGSFVLDGIRYDAPSGKVRALDARTGAPRWEFDPIPRDPDDPAAPTWGAGSALKTGQANVWSIMAADKERDLVFLPTTSPGTDFYGGLRPGDNRYANSLVALRGSTGELVWHYQISHHDLWDYDLPAQPILIDLPRGGDKIPAVVQLTKQGLVFVFHRDTGEPLFPIEERPVPRGGVPGERPAPTQPFPLSPPPLVAQGLWPEDAWGLTFIDRWLCRRKIASLRHGPIYTPPSLEGTVQMPSPGGGANWGGGAYDPERHLLVVPTVHFATIIRLVPREKSVNNRFYGDLNLYEGISFPQQGTPYAGEFQLLASPLGVPCTRPPWGRLSAIDLTTGTIKWQVALGTLEKLLPLPLPLELGTPQAGGPIVTKGGLAFIAASLDDKFRAFDIETGEILWETSLPAGGQATPMTYAIKERQYVVIAAGGHSLYHSTPGDYVIAFTLKPRP
jgi:quinoprotein glucose dehydrogenase